MNPGEYEAMARVEEGHWWYRGLRDAIARTLVAPRFRLPEHPRVLDVGCGTGQNLRLLRELLDPSYLGGFDASEEALSLARDKAQGADLYLGDICAPELHVTDLDLVTSFDVLYIPGARRALGGLERLTRHLRPGGLMLWNLPAYDWLYSTHDVAIHTSERYTLRQVRRLLERLGLRVELISYRLCLLFPAVVVARLRLKRRARPGDTTIRSDLHRLPGARVNALLAGVLRVENAWVVRGVRLPFGSSIFAVARRP